MKRTAILMAVLAAGAFLGSGAGEARADSCGDGDRFVIQYSSGSRGSWGHGRGHGRGYGRGFSGNRWGHHYEYGPVRRYTQVVAPACPPAQVVAPDYGAAYANTLVVNVRNSNGSYTPVTLRRVGNVYVGPRGEQYLSVPTEDQLKAVYGLE